MVERFLGLQILRFIAAMLVVLMHTAEAISLRSPNIQIFNFWGPGSVGVDIFFVISGFVMAISTEKIVPSFGNFTAAKTFLVKRFIRIAPLYWFYTIAKIIFVIFLPSLALRTKIDLQHIIASFAFIPAESPWGLTQPILPVGWTLNFEMLFYVIFAIAIAFNISKLFLPIILFSLLFIISNFLINSIALEFYSKSIIFEFVLGIIVFNAYRKFSGVSPIWAFASFLLGCFLIFFVDWAPTTDRLSTYGVASALLVFSVVMLEKNIRGKLAEKMSILGDISYSIYLSHSFTVPGGVYILAKIGIANYSSMIFCVSSIVILGGFLSFYLIETPLITFSRKLLLGKNGK